MIRIMTILGLFWGVVGITFGSVLDSGKSPQEIAAEIVSGARARYELQQREKEKIKVTMYATKWCGYCRAARGYFAAKDIKYVEYDIEHDRDAKAAFKRLGGKGVPLIVINNQVMRGFSEERFERFYRASK